jgi:hypothetical protein
MPHHVGVLLSGLLENAEHGLNEPHRSGCEADYGNHDADDPREGDIAVDVE